jgi:hypothetical protein
VGWGGGEVHVHNVDYDPGPWRQTLSLPPQLIPVLRIRDVYPLSQIPDPDFKDPGSKKSNKREG